MRNHLWHARAPRPVWLAVAGLACATLVGIGLTAMTDSDRLARQCRL